MAKQQSDDIHPRLIRFPEVQLRTSKSRSAIYALIDKGEFPKPVKLGRMSVAFVESEIDDWLEALIAERDNEAA